MHETTPFSCFLIGEESLLIRCAEALLAQGHDLRGVISSEPQLVAWATANGIPTVHPDAVTSALGEAEPFDYLFSITNLKMLSSEILTTPHRLAINFHDGPLPQYAGLHATTWALLDGVSRHAVTWHVMEPAAATGDILKQRWFAVETDETALTLNSNCYEHAVESFSELIDELAAGTVRETPQDLASRTYFGRFKRPDAAAALRFHRPAEDLAALVRALDFGPYRNPLALPKLVTESGAVAVTEASVTSGKSGAAPGTIVGVDDSQITVATATNDLSLTRFTSLEGRPLAVDDVLRALLVARGSSLALLSGAQAEALTSAAERSARHEHHWRPLLTHPSPVHLPFAPPAREATFARYESLPGAHAPLPLGRGGCPQDATAAAFALFLGRISGQDEVDVWRFDSGHGSLPAPMRHLMADSVPVRVGTDRQATAASALSAAKAAFQSSGKRAPFTRDLIGRLRGQTPLTGRLAVASCIDPAAFEPGSGYDVVLAFDADAACHVWWFDPARLSGADVSALQRQFGAFASQLAGEPELPLGSLSLLTADERHQVIHQWNDTAVSFPVAELVHQSFEAQVNETPHATAVYCGSACITYAELNARANRLAHYLRERGVGEDVLVGVNVGRSIEMVVAILAVHKAGGAYLPLDPEYPKDRIRFMLEDSAAALVLTDERNAGSLIGTGSTLFRMDTEWRTLDEYPGTNPAIHQTSSSLAYVIYTSGSTGKPKGVQVEHRNVQNFFTGMDERLGGKPAGTWLAVTSLSFDISVLELLWTLTRGFTVALYTAGAQGLVASASSLDRVQPLSFSLFFFAASEGEADGGAYDLLLEAAKFADSNGFEAIWTPERHFHAFGGLFPNPSVTSAAIAAVTKHVKIRAGSCVLPLHSPIRVAEEWSMVDNLSRGRAGISFAAGWQPDDFVLQPANFANAKEVMIREIGTVRRLWRGEAVEFAGHDGRPVPVRILPRPIQAELPIWITSAGNAETFRVAGEMGANVLTHLLGQSLSEVAERIAVYRAAWQEAGHPGEGHVTLMLHTFVGTDDEEVKAIVREPMIEYLRSSIGLIKQFAWSFPAFKNRPAPTSDTSDLFASLTAEELRALLEYSFERYYETSGLFGTPERCNQIIDGIRGIGVDEVGCLIDFGVPQAAVLKGLELLNQVRATAQRPGPEAVESVAALIERTGATHLQCTPSMASVLVSDPVTKAALSRLECLMVGGEAFPVSLAAELQSAIRGRVLNMYGPTETTIWSSTHLLSGSGDSIPIGKPIANTAIYALDENRNPVPSGSVGELFIGGAGVVRGYLNRAELTHERFLPDPFSGEPGGRMYRTGDLGRHQPDGTIEFLGRIDNQVKIRGHRIEMGEIETAITAYPGIREAVVVARPDDSGGERLVAYFVPAAGHTPALSALREHLAAELPSFMLPASFVVMDALPQTPNAKVDRKALPSPTQTVPIVMNDVVAAQGPTEERIAGIWSEVLGAAAIDRRTTFFELGGNSLLLVKVHRRLVDELTLPVALTDLFRFPTVESLSAFLDAPKGGFTPAGGGRADARRDALMRRRAVLTPVGER